MPGDFTKWHEENYPMFKYVPMQEAWDRGHELATHQQQKRLQEFYLEVKKLVPKSKQDRLSRIRAKALREAQ